MSFDGNGLIALDDDAYGSGGGGDTRPLDTALEHGIKSNAEWINGNRRRGVTRPFNSSRTLSSYRYRIVSWCQYPISPSLETLTSHVLLSLDPVDAETSPSITPNYDAQVKFRAIGATTNGDLIDEDIAFTDDDTPQLLELNLDFTNSTIQSQRWITLEWHLRTRSNSDDDYPIVERQSSDATVNRDGRIRTTIEKDLAESSRTFVRLSYSEGSEATRLDLSQEYQQGDSGRSTEEVWVSPDALQASGDITILELLRMTGVQVQSIQLEETNAKETSIKSSEQISGMIPYESQQSSSKHGIDQQQQYQRIRPIGMGWEGYPQTSGEWDREAQYWGYTYGNSTAGDPREPSISFKVDTESTVSSFVVVEARMFLLGAHLLQRYTRGADDDLETILDEDAGDVEFDLTISVRDEVADTVLSDTTETINLPLIPSDRSGKWPSLQTMSYLNFEDADFSAASGQLLSPANQIENWGEGVIYPRERGIWNPRSVAVEVPDPSRSQALGATFDASITNFSFGTDDPHADHTTKDHLAVVFSGLSLFERPQ